MNIEYKSLSSTRQLYHSNNNDDHHPAVDPAKKRSVIDDAVVQNVMELYNEYTNRYENNKELFSVDGDFYPSDRLVK